MGAQAATFRAELVFDDDSEYTLYQRSLSLAVGRRLGERASVVLGGGVVTGGSLIGAGRRYHVGTGFVASATGGYRVFGGRDGEPYGVGTLSMGLSRTHASHAASGEDEALGATDLRIGGELGITLFEHLRPFALARAFGGPVEFVREGEKRTGSDRHHYALGFGARSEIWRGFELGFETSLAGERAFVWSASAMF